MVATRRSTMEKRSEDQGSAQVSAALPTSLPDIPPAVQGNVAGTSSQLPSREAAASPSSSSQRLDPSLFQAYFSKPVDQRSRRGILKVSSTVSPSNPSEDAALARQISLARRAARLNSKGRKKRHGEVVFGRDGLSMRRLQDGRTIVRSLRPSATVDAVTKDERAEHSDKKPLVQRDDTELFLKREQWLRQQHQRRHSGGFDDAAERLATRKSSSFINRKLGLAGQCGEADTGSIVKAQKRIRNEDDPLGLGDPAFLPGGEFAHLAGLTGKGKRHKISGTSDGPNGKYKSASRDDGE